MGYSQPEILESTRAQAEHRIPDWGMCSYIVEVMCLVSKEKILRQLARVDSSVVDE